MAITLNGTTGITTPALDTSGDVTFADNDKAIFGAGSDLQIYHNGSTSVIEDSGTGALQIKATDLEIRSYTTNENYIYCVENGAVTLYYNDAAKIATTATGVTVTGTVAATAYTGDGSALTGVGSTTFGDVGTYTMGRPENTTSYTQGDTTAAFYATQASTRDLTSAWYNAGTNWLSCTATSQAGTWRCMADAKSVTYGGALMGMVGLWVRIA